jgi:beta-hydroxylase
MFDESFEHEAWNRTDGMRAVLFLDIVRPLRQPARAVNAAALAAFAVSPYALATKRRNEAWEATQGRSAPGAR